MKKYILVFTFLLSLLTSCSLDDSTNNYDYYLEVLPIESVDIPEQFVQGETYEISMTYIKPNSCYQFNDFIYEINGNQRTIAIVNTVYYSNDSNCVGGEEEVSVSFNFTALENDDYIFKFFQGQDAQGMDQYYIVEVPVVDGRLFNVSTNPNKN